MATFEESFLYPLILLLVGAGVSGVIVNWLTNRWQDRRKERDIELEDHKKKLEVKVDIVSKMSEASAYQMVNAATSIRRRKKAQTDTELDAHYEDVRKWYVDVNIIRSKLESYFPEADIRAKWVHYCAVLLSYSKASQLIFYEAPSEAQKKELKLHLETLKTYFSSTLRQDLRSNAPETKVEDHRILDWDRLTAEMTYNEDLWRDIASLIFKRGNEIIKDVLKLPIKVF